MGDLKAVLSALKGAKGRDWEIDVAIYRALGCTVSRRGSSPFSHWIMTPPGRHDVQVMPRVTTSVDACLALVAEKLPGWEITIVTGMDGNAVQLFSPGRAPTVTVPHAASVAIGLLTALFSALSAQSEGQPSPPNGLLHEGETE